MLVVNRFVVEEGEVADFADRAVAALSALAAQRGFHGGDLARALDEPDHWVLTTRWESVGAYRRALGGYEVKVNATPLLARSVDEPSAYEVLASVGRDGVIATATSDRAADDSRPFHR